MAVYVRDVAIQKGIAAEVSTPAEKLWLETHENVLYNEQLVSAVLGLVDSEYLYASADANSPTLAWEDVDLDIVLDQLRLQFPEISDFESVKATDLARYHTIVLHNLNRDLKGQPSDYGPVNESIGRHLLQREDLQSVYSLILEITRQVVFGGFTENEMPYMNPYRMNQVQVFEMIEILMGKGQKESNRLFLKKSAWISAGIFIILLASFGISYVMKPGSGGSVEPIPIATETGEPPPDDLLQTLTSTPPPTFTISPTITLTDTPIPPVEIITPPPSMTLDEMYAQLGSFDWEKFNYYEKSGYPGLSEQQKFISCILESRARGNGSVPFNYIHYTTYVDHGVDSLRALSALSNENFTFWYGEDGNSGYLGELFSAMQRGSDFPDVGQHPIGTSYAVFQGDTQGRIIPLNDALYDWAQQSDVFIMMKDSRENLTVVNPPQFLVDHFDGKAVWCDLSECTEFHEGEDSGSLITVTSSKLLNNRTHEFINMKFANANVGTVTFVRR